MFLRHGVKTQTTKCMAHIVCGGLMGSWEMKGNTNMGTPPENGAPGMKPVNFREKSGLKMGRKQKAITTISKVMKYQNPNPTLKRDCAKARSPLAPR